MRHWHRWVDPSDSTLLADVGRQQTIAGVEPIGDAADARLRAERNLLERHELDCSVRNVQQLPGQRAPPQRLGSISSC